MNLPQLSQDKANHALYCAVICTLLMLVLPLVMRWQLLCQLQWPRKWFMTGISNEVNLVGRIWQQTWSVLLCPCPPRS